MLVYTAPKLIFSTPLLCPLLVFQSSEDDIARFISTRCFFSFSFFFGALSVPATYKFFYFCHWIPLPFLSTSSSCSSSPPPPPPPFLHCPIIHSFQYRVPIHIICHVHAFIFSLLLFYLLSFPHCYPPHHLHVSLPHFPRLALRGLLSLLSMCSFNRFL